MSQQWKAWINELGSVEVDVTDLRASGAKVIDEIFDEIVKIARPMKTKPYVMVCWKNTKMDEAAGRRYHERVPEIYALCKAIVRYEVTDFVARVSVQLDAATSAATARSHIFRTREEAVQAIKSGRLEPAPPRAVSRP